MPIFHIFLSNQAILNCVTYEFFTPLYCPMYKYPCHQGVPMCQKSGTSKTTNIKLFGGLRVLCTQFPILPCQPKCTYVQSGDIFSVLFFQVLPRCFCCFPNNNIGLNLYIVSVSIHYLCSQNTTLFFAQYIEFKIIFQFEFSAKSKIIFF